MPSEIPKGSGGKGLKINLKTRMHGYQQNEQSIIQTKNWRQLNQSSTKT